MIATPERSKLTPEQYLALEEASEVRHEFVNGRVFAMAGTTGNHNKISMNCAFALTSHLDGSGCDTFMSDVKTYLDRLNIYYYPDVFVTCDERDREDQTVKRFPCLIIEVLSNSTESFDRSKKFENYQTLESLEEYVLIDQYRQRVDCFRRTEQGLWLLQGYGPNEVVHFQSVGWQGSIDSLYRNVQFTEA